MLEFCVEWRSLRAVVMLTQTGALRHGVMPTVQYAIGGEEIRVEWRGMTGNEGLVQAPLEN